MHKIYLKNITKIICIFRECNLVRDEKIILYIIYIKFYLETKLEYIF